jgi:hypothetical protein
MNSSICVNSYTSMNSINLLNTWIDLIAEFILSIVDCIKWIHIMIYYFDLSNSYIICNHFTWIDILYEFINQGFLQSFHFYVVSSLHSIKLNPITQPQILKSRCVFIGVHMFLIFIVVEVMIKQRLVIMDKIDLLNLFVLGMEKLEDDIMINPHCIFTLLSTVAIHIILMWRNNTTISKLFNISNTRWPYSINFLTRPTNLISCFITKKNPNNILTLIHAKNESVFFDFLETYHFLTCFQTWLPCLWIGTWLSREQLRCCIMICVCIKQQHHGQIIYHKLGKRNVHLGQKNEE